MKSLLRQVVFLATLAWLLCPGDGLAVPCGEVSDRGCCDGIVLNYCAEDFLLTKNCLDSCGWNPISQYYECEASGEDPTGSYPIDCNCTPQCGGKTCGDDGCGGTCGTCAAGATCSGGVCSTNTSPLLNSCQNACGGTAPDMSCYCDALCEQSGDCCADVCQFCGICDSCEPSCEGKECGDDGCNQVCGTCDAGSTCDDGICKTPATTGTCENVCGDISLDQTCYCDPICLENGDCCIDSCEFCGLCADCTPECGGKECGDNGCGELCGVCPQGEVCSGGMCSPGSATGSCADACGGPSPDQTCFCDDGCEEAGNCCPDVCTYCGICDTCTPSCGGKECGDNGCAGTCGVCPAGQACTNGVCTGTGSIGPTCKGLCGGKGQDGTCWCDKDCASNGNCCPDVCDECGYCGNDACQSNCSGKECGDDGCGQPCGFCEQGNICTNGLCKPSEGGTGSGNDCIPSCAQKQCGNDGCGGSCGLCPTGQICGAGICQNTTGEVPNTTDRVAVDPVNRRSGSREGENGLGFPTIQVEKSSCRSAPPGERTIGLLCLLGLLTVLSRRNRNDRGV